MRKGFTIIEVLVVIAVAVILTAILAPALSHAREASRLATCKNNLHQINYLLASRQFLDDELSFLYCPTSKKPYPLDLANIAPSVFWANFELEDRFCPILTECPTHHIYILYNNHLFP